MAALFVLSISDSAGMLHKRHIFVCSGLYVLLSLCCFALSIPESIPASVEWAFVALAYAFWLLGPPANLLAGSGGVAVYAAQTLLLVALVILGLIVRRRSPDISNAIIAGICVFWVLCGFLSLAHVI